MKNFSKGNKNTRIYIYLLIIIICGIFLFFYLNKWKEVKEEEKYLNSYLISTNTISLELNDIKDINNVLSETRNNYFVYISYTKDKNIYKLEQDLKPLIDEYNIQNYFYFINVTDIKEEKNNSDYKLQIAEELNVSKNELNKIPVILYFKDSKLIKSVTNAKDFKKLLEEQNIKTM